ncbi:MAG: iron-sulfur cluster assembly scaffold protein [Candidatus Andersenbacteria bacterium]
MPIAVSKNAAAAGIQAPNAAPGKAEVVDKRTGQGWVYTDIVKDHFFKPRNLLLDETGYQADGVGYVGSPACGDYMKMWIKVDGASDRIKELKWRTFGCASAIASTSMLSIMTTEAEGMKVDEALKLKPQDIMKRLGNLPTRKVHCSVLGDKALRQAINDYFRRSKQDTRVIKEGAKIVDKVLKITDRDIEEAVLEGADTFEKVQKKTKVGTGDPTCIEEVHQLIRFYREKYFG